MNSRCVRRAVVMASLTIGMGGLLSACVETPQRPLFYENMASPSAVVDQKTAAQMISQYRVNEGLTPVVPDPALYRIALEQSQAMARGGNVKASLRPEMKLARRMTTIGEAETHAVENVSGGYRTLAEAFSGWRESPKHRAVMLDGKAQRFGLATAYAPGAKHRVFWTLVMAGPKAGAGASGQTGSGTAPKSKPGS